jgi:hypothetical protein
VDLDFEGALLFDEILDVDLGERTLDDLTDGLLLLEDVFVLLLDGRE